jgi:ectoine hydroxylase-related dioxygenase (phytanoyl-CoA dioxygenase family)
MKRDFAAEIRDKGFCVVPDIVPPSFIAACKAELMAAIEKEAEWHGKNDYKDFAQVLVCAVYGGTFVSLFDHPDVMRPVNAVLGDGSIVYGYTSSSMPPGRTNYGGRIHRDSPRYIPGYITNVGVIIMLDDFTEENGATWFLPGSEARPDLPTEEEFYANAQRLVASAGSAFYFNARVVHAGGVNRTDLWRHALTINMCRPWMKQRLDIPRMMAHLDLGRFSETALQKLGFRAQVPASYQEFHAPPEKRPFRQKPE